MAKTLKDIIGNRAGRKIPGKETEYLDQHKVDEVPATYVVKDVAVGVKGINDPKNEGLVQAYISGAKDKRAEVHKDGTGTYHVKKFDAAGPNGKLVTTKSYSDAGTAHSIAKAHLSEDEELNELSSGTLKSYLKAARSDKKSSDNVAHKTAEIATSNPKMKDHNGYFRKEIAKHTFKAASANSRKRAKGMNTATSKLARRDPVESVEPVNELSTGTLQRYHNKARWSRIDANLEGDGPDYLKSRKTVKKRTKGINTATKKLADRYSKNEEVIDELSLDTLRSYRRKSGKEYMHHYTDRYINNNTSDDNRKSMDKRMRGGWKASSKIMSKKGFTNKGGKWVKEEEQLVELSKKTLGSYIKGATNDVSFHSFSAGNEPKGKRLKHDQKSFNRQKGINKAVDKITKEEEQLDEVKRNICNRTKIGIPCPKHGMKNCFALCEDDQVDEKMYLSKGKGVASILADKHTRLADKHLYKDDPEGAKEFHKHARAANRYSRIAKGKPPFSEDTTDENEYQDTSAMLREDWDAMSHEAKELVLHGDNVQHLNSHSHVVNVLYRKNAAGVYNHEKAKKLWKYHADNVARDYAKTHSYAGGKDWHKLFSPAHRNEVASHYAERARDTHGFGKTRPIKEEETVDEVWNVVHNKKVIHTSPDAASAYRVHKANPGSELKSPGRFGGQKASIALAPFLNKEKNKKGMSLNTGPWGAVK